MKLENQVCSIEQAKRLKELGVTQRSNVFHWLNGTFGWVVTQPDFKNIGKHFHHNNEQSIAAAFTVAELGIAIGKGTKAAEMLHNDVMVAINSGHSITIVLDPIFLCDSLIRSIENGHITPASVNQRLKVKKYERN